MAAPPPGPRRAYHRDGTIGFIGTTEVDPAVLRAMNSLGSAVISGGSLLLLFPVPMRLRGIFALAIGRTGIFDGERPYPIGSFSIATSQDTTNGFDGTFSAPVTVAQTNPQTSVRDSYVSLNALDGYGIVPLSGGPFSNVKALRILGIPNYPFTLHLYAQPDTVAGGQDFVEIWSTTQDAPQLGGVLSFGNVAPATSSDRTFRLRNRSSLHTANNIVLTAEEPPEDGTVAPVLSQFLFSLDGVDFSAPLNIGSLGPGATSGRITVRRDTPLDAPLGAWSPYIAAAVGSWT